MKKRKLNIKGLLAILGSMVAYTFIIYDFIQLAVFHKTYTTLGIITIGLIIAIGMECENYIADRLNR